MSSGMNLQERNRDQSAALGNVPFISRAGNHDIEIRKGRGSHAMTLGIREDAHEIGTLQSGSSPEIPAVGVAGEIAELNIGFGGGFKHAALPPGNGHSGTTKPPPELHLAEAVVVA